MIFWAVSLPVIFLRPEQYVPITFTVRIFHLRRACSYRIPAIISSVLVTIAAITTFIWALVKQGDIGPLWKNPEQIYGVGHLTGSKLSWTIMRIITSGIGGWAGGILYQSGQHIPYRQLNSLQH
jgi:nucleobase:cation symporter-1, NCS1 family